jgi:hypothetical protein
MDDAVVIASRQQQRSAVIGFGGDGGIHQIAS